MNHKNGTKALIQWHLQGILQKFENESITRFRNLLPNMPRLQSTPKKAPPNRTGLPSQTESLQMTKEASAGSKMLSFCTSKNRNSSIWKLICDPIIAQTALVLWDQVGLMRCKLKCGPRSGGFTGPYKVHYGTFSFVRAKCVSTGVLNQCDFEASLGVQDMPNVAAHRSKWGDKYSIASCSYLKPLSPSANQEKPPSTII